MGNAPHAKIKDAEFPSLQEGIIRCGLPTSVLFGTREALNLHLSSPAFVPQKMRCCDAASADEDAVQLSTTPVI